MGLFHELERPRHCVSFSGGKDSTAMLLMMIEKGMPSMSRRWCTSLKLLAQLKH